MTIVITEGNLGKEINEFLEMAGKVSVNVKIGRKKDLEMVFNKVFGTKDFNSITKENIESLNNENLTNRVQNTFGGSVASINRKVFTVKGLIKYLTATRVLH